jgi:L-Lysine epsilon oxidase N-terminal/L-lysine epsilon oxidase C-terminal domain
MPRRYRIHPAIGIARMGNSPDHFVGPETPGVPANWDDSTAQFKPFRDPSGRILRQGARFRVYEYPDHSNGAKNEAPREVVVGDEIVDIEWRVHLANRKASFYVFDGQNGAHDVYRARSALAPTQLIKEDPDRTNLRNADVPASDRVARLDIDPGEKLISGNVAGPVELANSKAHIPIKSLGTLLVDEKGRLIVLGGYGESNSTELPPRPIDEYASNDTWFDDASDGSVKARLRFKDGRTIDADPAWVLVGPPKFAPAIGNVVSLFDTLWDIGVREISAAPLVPSTPMLLHLMQQKKTWTDNGGASLSGFKPSFVNEIYPLLRRAFGARDVHVSGPQNPHYHRRLSNWRMLSSLSGPSAADGAELRRYIFNWMRNPDAAELKWEKMPRGLGDDYSGLDKGAPTPQSLLSLTRIQYAMLREWAAGNFIDDWAGSEPTITTKSDLTPDDLDRAAMENCVGGPFYPGIEVSWLIRLTDLYSEPFRLKVPHEPEDEVQHESILVGALEFRPGFFSQQMALPWQADFYDCHKERWQDPDGNEYFFMWWTAQRPDDVFSAGEAKQVRWVREFDKQATTPDNPDDPDNLAGCGKTFLRGSDAQH